MLEGSCEGWPHDASCLIPRPLPSALLTAIGTQAPKPSPAQRSALTLEYFRSSLTAHTLKDLEKVLPKVSSVAAIQVKDHVQALVDEGLVKIEKIGSGNWYWCFGNDEKRARESTLSSLKEEQARCEEGVKVLQEEVANKDAEAGAADEAEEKADLKEEVGRLKAEVKRLGEDVEGYADLDPRALDEKKAESRREMDRSERWTENCWALEGWLKSSLGVDREGLDNLQRQCYGDEYADGEGLKE